MPARDRDIMSRAALPGGPQPPRSCLDRGRSPTTGTELDAMRRRAWQQHGVATLTIDDVWDPLLRQAITNEANRRWGRRGGDTSHGR